MKLKTLVDSKFALENLIKISLPVSTAWELKKFVKTISIELKSYEEIKTQKIIELGEEIKEGEKLTGQFQVKKENMLLFIKLMTELQEKDIEVSVPQIMISELISYKTPDGRGVELSSSDLLVLDWLIIDNDESVTN